jgi:hypothetical protein
LTSLPLFKNDIDGFSLEERTVPEYWWSDDPEIDPWMWRAIIARRHDCVLLPAGIRSRKVQWEGWRKGI